MIAAFYGRTRAFATPSLIAALALLLAGCAHGILTPLPAVDADKAATVTVVRESHFVGGGSHLTITVDDQQAFALRTGEHVVFSVGPG
jgi:hypothetical protein